MFKRSVIFLFLCILCTGFVFSQQLTRVAVVDLPRVYTEFFRESRAVREFEERSARVQSDIDRMQNEIQELRTRHAEALMVNNITEVLRLETEISRRTDNLRNFFQARTAELDAERRTLMQSDIFLNQIHDEIRYIAESEGFTHVFDNQNTPGLIWYSPTFDITDRLIHSLRTRFRN